MKKFFKIIMYLALSFQILLGSNFIVHGANANHMATVIAGIFEVSFFTLLFIFLL